MATIGAGAIGTAVSGAGFILAPTGIAGTIIAASIWGVGKFALKRVRKRWDKGSGYGVQEETRQERMSGPMRMERGPDAVPW
jgi:hypothetical protein